MSQFEAFGVGGFFYCCSGFVAAVGEIWGLWVRLRHVWKRHRGPEGDARCLSSMVHVPAVVGSQPW